jgi:hypothetical protein
MTAEIDHGTRTGTGTGSSAQTPTNNFCQVIE